MKVIVVLIVVVLSLLNIVSSSYLDAFISNTGSMKCPTSGSSVHAGCEVAITFTNSCDDVSNEMLARINGQYNAWHDPHNNGTYTLTSSSSSKEISVDRKTGDGSNYVDKIIYTLTPSASNGCDVTGCSQSQVFSIGDYGTNYCNVHNLYCSDDSCYPQITRLSYTEQVLKCTQATVSSCSTV
jgi:hypothetical protein